ncbi:MAG: hypothetical protein COX62_06205 [Deltaproteobacteria bacterium CG_4_10_14_0_2_um_filter_43_8]|nr:MAG: hypothetical protein COV43_07335 [Deltaproteobacteria bacterium CG11_big_fil_rev_8_21_14_0_20_42_23]PJA19664.1 MAG: hypothetical protein COX62_06205 [Deltaproteobacteria bacterium CG_4_10_14_0_2_um_filter_43_8]PJC63919.1 MAG: hypothetical protein CO021_06830 [Deltaproteobacteria bacterium CG_4_9_14_0_2_um_filter_42_21]
MKAQRGSMSIEMVFCFFGFFFFLFLLVEFSFLGVKEQLFQYASFKAFRAQLVHAPADEEAKSVLKEIQTREHNKNLVFTFFPRSFSRFSVFHRSLSLTFPFFSEQEAFSSSLSQKGDNAYLFLGGK